MEITNELLKEKTSQLSKKENR